MFVKINIFLKVGEELWTRMTRMTRMDGVGESEVSSTETRSYESWVLGERECLRGKDEQVNNLP